jgi:CRP/FNR family transcriptional activator FtrB
MRSIDIKVVRDLPLFRGMQEGHFKTLTGAGYLQRFPGGVVLATEGERPDFLHVMVKGWVEFFSLSGGRETTLSFVKPAGAFILAAVVLDRLYLKSARTLDPSVILLIPAQAVRDILDKDAGFTRAVVSELAMRYRAVVKDLKNLRLRTSLERLANWILAHGEECGSPTSFKMPVEKRVLAQMLGMRPEHLSRSFGELTKLGISVRGSVVRIDDIAALREFARPDPLIDDPAT